MESISTAAIALATIVFSKAAKKSGENLGQLLSNRSENLIEKLKGKISKNIDLEEDRRSLYFYLLVVTR